MKISVIVPVYDAEPYIHQCVNSLLKQDYPDFEIILIDDGSPDNCGKICDEYMQKHNMIRVIHQENAGVSSARNVGLRIAKGDYITFVDADDWVDPDYLSILAKHMRPGGMSVCGRVIEDDLRNKSIIWKPTYIASQVISMDQVEAKKSVLYRNGICGYVCTKLFDREIIVKYDLEFRQDITILEDELFTIQYLSYTNKNVILDYKAVYHYRTSLYGAIVKRIKKYKKFYPEIFSGCIARAEMEKYVSEPSELLSLIRARQIDIKQACLFIMIINNWENLPYWKAYLTDVRLGLIKYLRCNTGDSVRAKFKMILCAVSPKLAWNCTAIWNCIKESLVTSVDKMI